MVCHLLKILIPAIISAPLLWEGIQCSTEGFSLKVPPSVTVQDGLCVDISCKFTYDASHYDPHADLYGYWYMEDKARHREHLVATSNPRRIKEINAHIRNRFQMSERKLRHGDCSLTINDAEAADEGIYHFRMEKGHRGYSYVAVGEKSSLFVTERKLDITFVQPLRAGQKESIFCKTQRCHHLNVPQITWTHNSNISILETYPTVNHNSVEGCMNFIPTGVDHQQNVTCKVTYGEGSSRRTTEKTVALNIHYPPRKITFNGHLKFTDGFVEKLNNISQVHARVGDSLLVRCEADANPTSNQTWVRNQKYPPSQQHISNNELKIFHLRRDNAGEYECQAKNQEGSTVKVLDLHVQGNEQQYSPMSGP